MIRSPSLAAFGLLAACTTLPAGQPTRHEGPAALGQATSVGGPVVTPLRIVEDSRCPMNARCIWEGNAKIAVKAEEYAAKPTDIINSIAQTLELNTSDKFAKKQPFGKFDVVLVHLEPVPMAGEKVRDYVATLRVEWVP